MGRNEYSTMSDLELIRELNVHVTAIADAITKLERVSDRIEGATGLVDEVNGMLTELGQAYGVKPPHHLSLVGKEDSKDPGP